MRCLKYVSMRAIGFMAGVMILQEFTDPTMILASGGILDRSASATARWPAR